MVRAGGCCSYSLTSNYGLTKGILDIRKQKIDQVGVGVWDGVSRRHKLLSCALADVKFRVSTSYHSYIP